MLGDFIDARDRLGFWCASFAGCSITAGLIRPMENVQKRKQELFKEYAEALTSDNPVTQVKASGAIESELLKMAKENLREDPGWDMYASGVNNFTNNFKTINVMRGAVFNNITKGEIRLLFCLAQRCVKNTQAELQLEFHKSLV